MQWSKLKKKVEDRFAKSVNGKVRLYSTVYSSKGSRCRCGRAWITFNGAQIVNFETIPNLNRTHRDKEPTNECGHLAIDQDTRSPLKLAEKGEFSRFHLFDACREILQLPIDAALSSNNPLVRGLAFLDARAGKQRILNYRDQEAHPLALALLEIRIAQDTKKSPNLSAAG
jgi:hypothetical protein